MKKYIINEIHSDGYERFAVIEEIEKNAKINVHFLEYDEYLENGEESRKKKTGDILEEDISIELVTFSRKTDDGLSHHQNIQGSPSIKAVIEITQIIDAYSIYAVSSILDNNILIEFESAVNYKVGERILVVGSLELNEMKD
ncbi:MAG: hypothetical protein K2O91_21555 [Lachnospiraceae bacterium]|nr:hypothetical protein [Lachnospiraceae bacterium]